MNWIIKLPNTFIGNEIDFIKEFLLYSIKENKNKMLELKNRNEENIKNYHLFQNITNEY